jgi:hypothetical protein
LLNRPLKAAFGIAVAVGLTAFALGVAGLLDVLVAGLGVICCALVAAVSGYAIWQGERALRSRLADERERVGKMRTAQKSRLFAWQAEHATRMREWRELRLANEHQKRWYAVCAPDGCTGWISPEARSPAGPRCSPRPAPTGWPLAARSRCST